MTPDEARAQVVRLKALEAARTNPDGGAKPGYRRNVELLRREIERCRRIIGADAAESIS